MIVGHTKFMPDSCFGLLKQKMRRTPIECLDDIVNVVNQSATVNRAHLVGAQDGKVLVPTYNWLSYFTEYFKRIPHIKDYHHFTASSDTPGVVTCKKYSDSSEFKHNLLKDPNIIPTTGELPPTVAPKGLSDERQWYLYDKIRPFCSSDRTKDLTCPLPSVPKPTQAHTPIPTPATSPIRPTRTLSHQSSSSSHQSSSLSHHPTLPPTKRARTCGKCGSSGHNRRSCKL